MLDDALKLRPEIMLVRWVNEDEDVNLTELDRKKRFKLLTQFNTPSKLVCAPDAAFVLKSREHNAVMYVEYDRDTYFHDRVAARKTPGYKKFLESRYHRNHFPETTLDHFFVLFFAPTEKRSRQLRDAFAKKNADDPALKVYRFGSFETLTAENMLTPAVRRAATSLRRPRSPARTCRP